MIPDRKSFQQTVSGEQVDLYILQNDGDMQVAVTNFGGRIVSLLVPDKISNPTDVVTGYDNLESYWKANEPYFGALIGRYGNRINSGKFSLEGKQYQLEINNGPNALHGGSAGFHNQVWKVESVEQKKIELSYFSKDGEEGFPGNLQVRVTYCITDDNDLKIDYQATTDQTTIVNLTNHTYFNLNGDGSDTVLNHELMINASKLVAIDENSIPLGTLMNVESTPFDFRQTKVIGSSINDEHEQLINGIGYDHTFVLNHAEDTLGLCAIARSPETGIIMEVVTTEPGVQFYSGNFLDGKEFDGKGGRAYPKRSAFCLETQHFPDSPNHPEFPNVVLKPGEVFKSTTIYKFSVQ